MTGKTVLITGASSGIGLEAAVKIAAAGADVVLVARSRTKGDNALSDVKRRSGSNRVSALHADLSSLASVRALADTFRGAHARLDVLVNNAGTVSPDRRTTADGFEQTFAVNHLAHFLLTTRLLDLLTASGPARIVNVSSAGHKSGDLDFDNLQYEHGGYSLLKAYARSKLANVLFTMELARRLRDTSVTANAVHPGAVATNIWTHTPWAVRPLVMALRIFMLSAERGAETIVHLAAGEDVDRRTGGYYEKMMLVRPSRLAEDADVARRLWDVSERLTSYNLRPGDPP